MKASARNVYEGTVLTVQKGAVNDEIEIVLDGGNTRITSVITSKSSKTLGLESGKRVFSMFKAPWVILLTDSEGVRFSARNQLVGTIVSVKEGTVNAEVRVRLDGGEGLTAIVTLDSVKSMGLEAGNRVTALVKASNVILGVRD
ncbi:MAG: TOBE domain-containing protein [Synergistaceae bacterium]|nr:TOBE domain-containing protein [Synergistaceae bacterium]